MNDVRIKSTEKERIALEAFGLEGTMLAMNENTIDKVIEREKLNKFNEELGKIQESFSINQEKVEEAQKQISMNAELAEIKPMFNRVLIKPFATNPFQQIKVEGGIITDTGGYNPHIQRNPTTGRYEEQDLFIKCGVIVETGPEVKYLIPGDAVYYRKDTVVPIPFLKQGLVSCGESLIISVVNENLTGRWKTTSF